MKSYSKVFKVDHLALTKEIKVISQPFIPLTANTNAPLPVDDKLATDASEKADQMIEAANAKAKEIIAAAKEDSQSVEAAAEERINQWWEENERKLEILTIESEKKGFDEGFAQGKQEAEQAVQLEYQTIIDQAESLLNQAYEQKAAIISEAEPFLLELSTVIAAQIIKKKLEEDPDIFVDIIKQHILRFKEKEFITVCVHPEDFEFIQSQRTHLNAVVNGETEIRIIPDHSVTANGCIIRTAYGSVDARIDTQLEEIKKLLLEARREPASETISG